MTSTLFNPLNTRKFRPTHYGFCSHVPEEDWITHSTSGKSHPLSPGQLRTYIFLTQIPDQITFVLELIDPETLIARINAYLHIVRIDLDPKMRQHLARLLETLCYKNELGRGEAGGILGLKSTATRTVIRTALGEGLIKSPSEKGSLSIAFPAKVVETYFPRFFTDLPAG